MFRVKGSHRVYVVISEIPSRQHSSKVMFVVQAKSPFTTEYRKQKNINASLLAPRWVTATVNVPITDLRCRTDPPNVQFVCQITLQTSNFLLQLIRIL